MNVIINGKFFSALLEGMPRVGREIVTALDDLLEEGAGEDLEFIIMSPPGTPVPHFKNIPSRIVGKTKGIIWEQFELPFYARSSYLVNFTGTAPVIMSQGCVVIHDAQFWSTPQSHHWKSRFLYGIITPIVARKYNTLITVSLYAREEIRNWGVTKRDDISVIYNGIDHMARRIEDRAILSKLKLGGKKYMLANSYAHTHKNVRTLFKAMDLGGAAYGPLVLFGSHNKDVYETRGIKVPENVIFAGRVSDEELVALMKSAYLFLFPSSTEGFGLPPLEAMYLGCPTLCSNAGAMPEICGSAARYASTFSPESWFDEINKLWNDEDVCAELSLLGKKRASDFIWKEAARNYIKTISMAIKQ